jgi:hypothetical protein
MNVLFVVVIIQLVWIVQVFQMERQHLMNADYAMVMIVLVLIVWARPMVLQK